jgi:D-sedoheptulose 7-phosphate isomerase
VHYFTGEKMSLKLLYTTALNDHTMLLGRLQSSESISRLFYQSAELLLFSYRNGNKLLLCGNGGSASDAQHIAAELVGRFYLDRPGIDAETLTVNTSSLTSITNDYSFDNVFARQVEAKGRPGDVLVGLTTSGTSKNILAAFEKARSIGMKNICFTGESAPSSLDTLCDVVLRVPSSCTPRIQEVHILLGHILCEYIEKELFGQG